MKTIEEVYPEAAASLKEHDYFDAPSDYHPLLASLEFNILLQIDDEYYHGDSRLIVKEQYGDRYGMLIFGWGSCSGCDALQACNSMKEIDDLRNEIMAKVQWFDSAAELLSFIEGRDWETQYCWHEEMTRKFVAVAIFLLKTILQKVD